MITTLTPNRQTEKRNPSPAARAAAYDRLANLLSDATHYEADRATRECIRRATGDLFSAAQMLRRDAT